MVNNPAWFDTFPLSPYNSIYPSWDRLISKTNKEIRGILKPYSINWPQQVYSDNTDLEVWDVDEYFRPTPVGGWKLIPHETFVKFFQGPSGILSQGLYQTTNAGPCVTHSWIAGFFIRYWIPQPAVFEIAIDAIGHQFNLAITANNDGSINVCDFDIFWNDAPKIMIPGVIPEKWNKGRVFHIFLP